MTLLTPCLGRGGDGHGHGGGEGCFFQCTEEDDGAKGYYVRDVAVDVA